jgi:hypothetical protein
MGGTTREVQWIVNGNNILAVTQALPPGGWHHVAITQTADHARLFVDGVLLSENFFSPSTLSDVLPPSVIVGGASGSFFKGLIDDLAVFQGPLSVAQINAYMSNGVPDATLSIQPSGKNVRLSWGDDLLGATLQASSTLTNNATTWTVVTGGTNSPVTLSTSNHSTFYRLQR